jgi:hypothetical protein
MCNIKNMSLLTDEEIKSLTFVQLTELTVEQLKELDSKQIELLEEKFGTTNIYFLIYIYKSNI